MRAISKLTVAGAVAALSLTAIVAATPAAADPWHHYHHGYWGPAVAAGVIGLAAGAIIASQQPVYVVNDGCVRWRPVYDRYGRYLGDRRVNVCY